MMNTLTAACSTSTHSDTPLKNTPTVERTLYTEMNDLLFPTAPRILSTSELLF